MYYGCLLPGGLAGGVRADDGATTTAGVAHDQIGTGTDQRSAATSYSQGLQAATLCLDPDFPWGGAQSAEHSRARKADRAVSKLTPAQLWPFNAAAARGNGELVMCEHWPRVRDPEVHRLSLVGVNALLVHGERDLGTPLIWAREAHRDVPGSRLVVVPDGGHSLQVGGAPTIRETVTDFLLR